MPTKPDGNLDVKVTVKIGDLNKNGRRDVTVVGEAANFFGDKPLTITIGPLDLPDKEVAAALEGVVSVAMKTVVGLIL